MRQHVEELNGANAIARGGPMVEDIDLFCGTQFSTHLDDIATYVCTAMAFCSQKTPPIAARHPGRGPQAGSAASWAVGQGMIRVARTRHSAARGWSAPAVLAVNEENVFLIGP